MVLQSGRICTLQRRKRRRRGDVSQEVGGRGAGRKPEFLPRQLSHPTPQNPPSWASAHLHGGDLHGRGTCGGGRARCHGSLRLRLGVGLGLHLSQGLLRDHEQLPILAPHEDHTWGAGEGAGVKNASQGPTPRGANSPEEERKTLRTRH